MIDDVPSLSQGKLFREGGRSVLRLVVSAKAEIYLENALRFAVRSEGIEMTPMKPMLKLTPAETLLWRLSQRDQALMVARRRRASQADCFASDSSECNFVEP
jgi:hypothetical protein